MKTVWPPPDLDPECRSLCEAINSLPGLRTYESCCGHGTHPFWIFFRVQGMAGLHSLANVVFWLDKMHCGREGWRCEVGASELIFWGYRRCSFCIEGPKNDYSGADEIAALIAGQR
jgi:hypothetical protein